MFAEGSRSCVLYDAERVLFDIAVSYFYSITSLHAHGIHCLLIKHSQFF